MEEQGGRESSRYKGPGVGSRGGGKGSLARVEWTGGWEDIPQCSKDEVRVPPNVSSRSFQLQLNPHLLVATSEQTKIWDTEGTPCLTSTIPPRGGTLPLLSQALQVAFKERWWRWGWEPPSAKGNLLL